MFQSKSSWVWMESLTYKKEKKGGGEKITVEHWLTGKFGRGVQNEAEQRLTEFCQENTMVTPNTLFQQHERTLHMDMTILSKLKSDWLCSLQPKIEKLFTVSKNKNWELTGSNHELLIAKLRLKTEEGKPLSEWGITKIKSLMIIQRRWRIDSRD